jgi:hypothetical protein
LSISVKASGFPRWAWGWLVGIKFSEDVDKLHFQVIGVLKDVERLKGLVDRFAAVLDRLCRLGSAERTSPGVAL